MKMTVPSHTGKAKMSTKQKEYSDKRWETSEYINIIINNRIKCRSSKSDKDYPEQY